MIGNRDAVRPLSLRGGQLPGRHPGAQARSRRSSGGLDFRRQAGELRLPEAIHQRDLVVTLQFSLACGVPVLTCTNLAGSEILRLDGDDWEKSIFWLRQRLAGQLGVCSRHVCLVLADGQLLSESDDFEPLRQLGCVDQDSACADDIKNIDGKFGDTAAASLQGERDAVTPQLASATTHHGSCHLLKSRSCILQ